MSAALNGVDTAIWGIITFSILIVLHEAGHFLTARAFGVKVHEFMLGLPGPALRLRTKNMTWGVTAVPLGGYVRIAGMNPGAEDPLLGSALGHVRDSKTATARSLASALGIDEARADGMLSMLEDWKALEVEKDESYRYALGEELAGLDPAGLLDAARRSTYRGQSTLKRVGILSMGVITNVVVALVTFTVVLSVWGYYNPTTTVESIDESAPAATAGVEVGDRLLALDGQHIDSWSEFQTLMSKTQPSQAVTLTVERGDAQLDIRATLVTQDGHGYLGIGPGFVHMRPTVWESFGQSLEYIKLTVGSIVSLLNPATFASTVGSLTGVVGISVMAVEAVKSGPIDYAAFIAMLSLSLGLMNLIPLPPLDGGKIVLEVVERIIRRPINPSLLSALNAMGSVLLFGLVGYVIYMDIARIVG